MYSLFCEAEFWTLKNDIQIRNTDFGAFRYYDKREIEECSYFEGKKSYCHERGTTFILKNKRPLKLKDSLKELEHQLATNKIVFSEWKTDNILSVVLNTGLLITIGVNVDTKDIYKITFDRFLIGKLLSENVCDVLSTKTHLVISYNESQLTIVNYTKSGSKLNVPQKLAKWEPRVQQVDLCGPSGRRVERHLSSNKSGDMILTWWYSTRNEVYPWSPLVKDEDRANIHIYSLEGTKIELLSYYRTEYDLISVNFSRIKPCLMWLIEQKVSKKGEVVIEYSSHEIAKKSLRRILVTSIPLQTQICCHSISPDEEKLILGCIDGSLVLFDEPKGITRLVKTAFIPNLVSWHADGALIIIANERSQFQFFDFALSHLRVQLLNEDVAPANILDLASYFKSQPTLLHMKWNKKSDVSAYTDRYIPNDGLLFLVFESGPIGVLKLIGGGGLLNDVQSAGLTADVIVRQYILWNQSDKALNLLLCLNWNTNGSTCLAALYHIANHIFRQPFTPEREVILEAALGTFYSPIRPLTRSSETEFGNQVHDLSRRFFYHLLRHRLYEKAYCLAIDLSNPDLFVDLYHCAKLLKDDEMAYACKSKFEEFSALSDSSSRSSASHGSCSCSDSSTDNEDNEDAILPPLPQISVKKAKASRVPPLPDLNRHNKLRESAFFNSTPYLPSDPLNGLPNGNTLGLPNALDSQTASTSFNDYYPSILNQKSKFLDFGLGNNLIPPPNFPHSYEIRTSFSGEEGNVMNFNPIESVPHKYVEPVAPKTPTVVPHRSASLNVFENICDALPLNPSLRQDEHLKKNYLPNRMSTLSNLSNLGPLKLKSDQTSRPNLTYGTNRSLSYNYRSPVQFSSLESVVSSAVGFRPISNSDKPGFRMNTPVNPDYYLPRNPNLKPEPSKFSPMRNPNNSTNLLLQRPLQFVPNAYSKPVMKPLNAHNVKQKVKFSDTVTQIVVPDISKISIEDETWISQQRARSNRTLKPTVINKTLSQPINSGASSQMINFTGQSNHHEEEEHNGAIKVIHFGVV